jgi:hypothetical protein
MAHGCFLQWQKNALSIDMSRGYDMNVENNSATVTCRSALLDIRLIVRIDRQTSLQDVTAGVVVAGVPDAESQLHPRAAQEQFLRSHWQSTNVDDG